MKFSNWREREGGRVPDLERATELVTTNLEIHQQ